MRGEDLNSSMLMHTQSIHTYIKPTQKIDTIAMKKGGGCFLPPHFSHPLLQTIVTCKENNQTQNQGGFVMLAMARREPGTGVVLRGEGSSSR